MMRRALLAATAVCACLAAEAAWGAGLDAYPVVAPGAADKFCGYANAAGHATQCSTVSALAGALPQNPTFPAPTSSAGSILLTPGSSPTSTPPSGSVWCTTVGCFAVVNGTVMSLGTVIPSTGAGGSTGQVQFNSSGVLSGVPGFSWNGSSLSLPSGVALPSRVSLTLPTLVPDSALMGGSGQTIIASPICGGVAGATWLVGTDISTFCSHVAAGGTDNLSFGTITLDSLTTGCCNLAFGSEVMHDLTTGSYNASFGFESSHVLVSGNQNTSVGYNALAAEQTGSANVAIGVAALMVQNGGQSNTALGENAGVLVSTASDDICIGAGACPTHTSGNKNISIGTGGGYGITTGHGNVWLGGQGATLSDQNDSVTVADGDGNVAEQFLSANGFIADSHPREMPALASSQGLAGGGFTLTNAGSGGTVACSSNHVCDSISGEATITTGTGSISAGPVLVVAFALTRTNRPSCVVSAFKAATDVPNTWSEVTSQLTINSSTPLATGTTYTVRYICGGI